MGSAKTNNADARARSRDGVTYTEKVLPGVFGLIGLAVFILFVAFGVFGHDYYVLPDYKDKQPTFFEERIKDNTTYAILVVSSALLGFMASIFDDIVVPRWQRISNIHASRKEAASIRNSFSSDSVFWVTEIAGRLWVKISDALMVYFAFTDLYIFASGFIGNVLGGYWVYAVYFVPKTAVKDNSQTDGPLERASTRSLVF